MKAVVSAYVLVIIGSAMAFPQSSFYASNNMGSYPQLLPRFGSDDTTNVGNRIQGSDTTATSNSNPSGSVHDPVIVDRVASWPKDRQPFWYINQQHVNSRRGQQVPCTNCPNPQQSAQQPMPQSPFARRT